jgi:hypothetical protein
MAQVLKLVPHKAKASSGVLKTLKNMTEAAHRLGATSIAIAIVDRAGDVTTAFDAADKFHLVGAIETVKHRIFEGD